MKNLRWIGLVGVAGAALLLGGCVVAPPAYQQGYDPYGQPVYAQPPVVIAPPAVSIGIGGFFRGGGYGRGGYYRGGGYWR